MKNSSNSIEHVYIHVPFCLQKCGYCSFYSEVFSIESKQKYLKSLLKEIELFHQQFEIKPKTIYFGGGTPSLLSNKEINSILRQFDLSQIEEITLEANPVTLTEDYSKALSITPVNRISLGIQSFDDKELKLLGRLHKTKQAEFAIKILRENGFSNISFDLIYGLPNQKIADLKFSIEKFIELDPKHISTYCLSLDENVPLFSKRDKIPADDKVSESYFLIREKLLEADYHQYEISNFAKPGFESKHNLCYWNDKFYLALGPAASGYLPFKNEMIRHTAPSDLNRYIDQIKQKIICGNYQKISREDHEKEFIFLAFRKTEGLNLTEFHNKFKIDFTKKYKLIIEKYLKQNLLAIESDFIRLSPEAYFVSNEILAEFM
ncbi:MAG: radical SAM family heme chaperone HemW [Candidatus Cloacimonetes bacterium]|nr:radical SAM family heme chaperone HemW [Candidatus Cloacimonadota bacterium]MCF7814547.1 radical SAM family heme chaperone HemW [Candidatus Cloacimonadota bacterium]MCF7868833.1 radical SAM family heme chaperone HemW [Candidatus Cloacimonadota bacterium]MCF7884227.1 radical SAM family heme chaperone HemW [Candidatus Cloacimonadota bacterium]